MKCSDVTPLLSLYMDKQLDAQHAESVKHHLNTCDSCREEYDELSLLIADISEIPQVALPLHFQQNLHLRLEQEAAKMQSQTESKAASGFRAVLDQFKEHKRTVFSLGIVAACTLIVFSTGIFDQMKPIGLDGDSQPNVIQNQADSTISAKPPVEGDAGTALQETPHPTRQNSDKTAVTPLSPSQSVVSEDSAKQPPAQAEPGQTTPATLPSEQQNEQDAPVSHAQVAETPTEGAKSDNSIENKDGEAYSFSAAAGGASGSTALSPLPESSTFQTAGIMKRSAVITTMYVKTKNPLSVLTGLDEIKERVEADNGRYTVLLTEKEYKAMPDKIKMIDEEAEITYGSEDISDPVYAYQLIIISE